MKKSEMKKQDMAKMMGSPTVEGLHMKVRLMTQKYHKNMMKEMKHDGMKMDKATKEAMMTGTHCIMLDVTDAAKGKEITNATDKVTIVSPSVKDDVVIRSQVYDEPLWYRHST